MKGKSESKECILNLINLLIPNRKLSSLKRRKSVNFSKKCEIIGSQQARSVIKVIHENRDTNNSCKSNKNKTNESSNSKH